MSDREGKRESESEREHARVTPLIGVNVAPAAQSPQACPYKCSAESNHSNHDYYHVFFLWHWPYPIHRNGIIAFAMKVAALCGIYGIPISLRVTFLFYF